MKWLFVVLIAIVATAASASGAITKDGTINSLPLQESEKICEPRSTFKHYCNTCECSSDGKSQACTLLYCDLGIWNKDGTMKLKDEKSEQICEPRNILKDYCNTCMCSEDGQFMRCTMRVCDAKIWNKDGSTRPGYEPNHACRPKSTFFDFCNMCKCTSDGETAICTRKICDYSNLNKDGTSKNSTKDNDRIMFENQSSQN